MIFKEKEVCLIFLFVKNKIIMPSSAIKRFKFEKEIFNILSCICAVCHRIRYLPDGRGPNIIGAFTKTVILVQCLESVLKLERLLSNFPKDTIGILVASSKNKFNYSAIERVRTSEYNIILTDKKHLCPDLIQFSTNRRSQTPLNLDFNFKLAASFSVIIIFLLIFQIIKILFKSYTYTYTFKQIFS
ncbi:hypothetical protein C2G38_856160 [Gigaspora rosea]|uniref:Uncharacterized protein n=1 Tax=Gigaspora rosea TaxID=44941 RepID=A0A397TXA8_9GLOM|nr:hypothetical protein C2G38_856160 [Gigaspora rosea]